MPALSYWTGPYIAHTLISFGFADGRFLTFSIEIRKEKGESFSAIGGFFKHFEMSLIAADERDILGVRHRFDAGGIYSAHFLDQTEDAVQLLLRCRKLVVSHSDTRQPGDTPYVVNGQ